MIVIDSLKVFCNTRRTNTKRTRARGTPPTQFFWHGPRAHRSGALTQHSLGISRRTRGPSLFPSAGYPMVTASPKPSCRLIDDLREKYPGLAKNAVRQRSSAIRLHCLECCGGNRAEVTRCSAPECALWPFRFGPARARIDAEQIPGDAGTPSDQPLPVDPFENPKSTPPACSDDVRPAPAVAPDTSEGQS